MRIPIQSNPSHLGKPYPYHKAPESLIIDQGRVPITNPFPPHLACFPVPMLWTPTALSAPTAYYYIPSLFPFPPICAIHERSIHSSTIAPPQTQKTLPPDKPAKRTILTFGSPGSKHRTMLVHTLCHSYLHLGQVESFFFILPFPSLPPPLLPPFSPRRSHSIHPSPWMNEK